MSVSFRVLVVAVLVLAAVKMRLVGVIVVLSPEDVPGADVIVEVLTGWA